MKQTIKQLRRSKGITQKEMAQRLKISVYAYQKIERSPAESEIKLLLAVANVLNIPVTDIFLFNNITKSNVKEQKKSKNNKVKRGGCAI